MKLGNISLRLIADSGATKTKLVVITPQGNRVSEDLIIGYNPNYGLKDTFFDALKKSSIRNELADIKEVYFYGSGINEREAPDLKRGFLQQFPQIAHAEIHNDLMAAGRSLLHHSAGMIGILGTGSSLAFYDGNEIQARSMNLGYLIHDEASGYDLGRRLLIAYYKNTLPTHVAKQVQNYAGDIREDILHQLYKVTFPSRWVAALARLLVEYRNEPYLQKIIENSFQAFIDNHLINFSAARDYSINFVGSIAYQLREELARSLEKNGYRIGKVIKDPEEQLIKYHTNLNE